MGETYLLDTNIVSKALRGYLSDAGLDFVFKIVNQETYLSVISRMELLGWRANDPELEEDIRQFVEASVVYNLTEEVIQQTIKIRRAVKIKLPDAIIAATAITHNLTLLSDNDVDFLRIPGLKYLNPAKL